MTGRVPIREIAGRTHLRLRELARRASRLYDRTLAPVA